MFHELNLDQSRHTLTDTMLAGLISMEDLQ